LSHPDGLDFGPWAKLDEPTKNKHTITIKIQHLFIVLIIIDSFIFYTWLL
jgi:hypothetical protein